MHEPTINRYFRFDAANMTDESARAQVFGETRHYAIADDNDEYLGTESLKEIDDVNKKPNMPLPCGKNITEQE